MLEYLSRGARDYSADPIPIYMRGVWEFQAVLRGRCAPTFPKLHAELAEKRLWIFSPNNAHGWTGESGRGCEIAVFHFDKPPDIMKTLLPRNGVASVSLSGAEIATIERHYRRCSSCLHAATVRSELVRQSALVELCLILAERMKVSDSLSTPTRQMSMMSSSLAWYEEHMSSGPSLREVAARTGVSESHLRRIYWAVLHLSPNQEFLRRRMSRAKYLLRITDMSISEVAFATGYGSVSTFSRAFSLSCGLSPKAWRQSQGAQQP